MQEEYERLQAEYSNLIAVRDEMVQVEAPRLEALYMETLGQLQYEVLSLEYDIALLKLERDLLQSYITKLFLLFVVLALIISGPYSTYIMNMLQSPY